MQRARLPRRLHVDRVGGLEQVLQGVRLWSAVAHPVGVRGGQIRRRQLQWQRHGDQALQLFWLPRGLHVGRLGRLERLLADLRRRQKGADAPGHDRAEVRGQELQRERHAAGGLQRGAVPRGLRLGRVGRLGQVLQAVRQWHRQPHAERQCARGTRGQAVRGPRTGGQGLQRGAVPGALRVDGLEQLGQLHGNLRRRDPGAESHEACGEPVRRCPVHGRRQRAGGMPDLALRGGLLVAGLGALGDVHLRRRQEVPDTRDESGVRRRPELPRQGHRGHGESRLRPQRGLRERGEGRGLRQRVRARSPSQRDRRGQARRQQRDHRQLEIRHQAPRRCQRDRAGHEQLSRSRCYPTCWRRDRSQGCQQRQRHK
mmetsp:Transcript_131688/g.357571  ORF Transcript_131688/g.357571 Transcript_131688/m.357571 type:complete len:370 (+) Transcript_131688:706-1815(+)